MAKVEEKKYYFVGICDTLASSGFDAWHFSTIHQYSDCYHKSYGKALEELEEAKKRYAQNGMIGTIGIFEFVKWDNNYDCYEDRIRIIEEKIEKLEHEKQMLIEKQKEDLL